MTIQRLNNGLLPVSELQKVVEVKQEVGKELRGFFLPAAVAFQVVFAGCNHQRKGEHALFFLINTKIFAELKHKRN